MAKPHIINADVEPTDANPHSWLVLQGDEPGMADPRIMTGTLRPLYRGYKPTAVAFARAKLEVAQRAGVDPWTVTAARAEVLLPHGTDDRFASPRVLMEEADALATGPSDALLSYVTLTWMPNRLHEMYEEVRAFALVEIVSLGCPVLLVQHAPHLARSNSVPHCHLITVPVRLTQLGWAGRVNKLAGDKVRALVVSRFAAFRAARAQAADAACA